jgi:hypothetical protein
MKNNNELENLTLRSVTVYVLIIIGVTLLVALIG